MKVFLYITAVFLANATSPIDCYCDGLWFVGCSLYSPNMTWDDSHHSPHGCHGPRSVVPLWGADAWDLGGFLRWSLAWSGDHLLSGGAGRQHRRPEAMAMKIFNAKMVAEALVIGKGYHIFRQTQIGRLWPFGRFFLGGMWKKTKTHFDLTDRNSTSHRHLVGGLTHDSILQPIWDDYPNWQWYFSV